ncbi:MAG: hypothetical protein ACLSCQ_00885 [Evtepia gabavorous]
MSAERCAAELGKLLCGPAAGRILRAYPAVLGVVIPELLPMVGFAHRNAHHCYDVWTHTAVAVDHAPRLPLRLAMLLHDMGKPDTFSLGEDGQGHFYGHPGGAWSWRKESSPGCGFPGGPGSKCCAWCATMTRSSRRAPSGCAAGSTNWGRSAFLICWRSSGDASAQAPAYCNKVGPPPAPGKDCRGGPG